MTNLPNSTKGFLIGIACLVAMPAHGAVALPHPSGQTLFITAVANETEGGYTAGQAYIFRFTALFPGYSMYYIGGAGTAGEYDPSQDGSFQTYFQVPEPSDSPVPYVFTATIDLSAGAPFFGLKTLDGSYITAIGGYVEVPSDYTQNFGYSWEKTQRDYGPVPEVNPTAETSNFGVTYVSSPGQLETVDFTVTNLRATPEPSAALLGLVSAASLLRRRR